jgi:hypothetical protein
MTQRKKTHHRQKHGRRMVTAGRTNGDHFSASSFCQRTHIQKQTLLGNGVRYPLVGGTRLAVETEKTQSHEDA